MKLFKSLKSIGPGPIIAAAFIGPGTVTVCSIAGVNYGFGLLWAMVLSIIMTGVLQESSGRIGIVTGKDLSQILRSSPMNKVLRTMAIPLVIIAIGIGNAAYESGNITGASLGFDLVVDFDYWLLGSLTIDPGTLILGVITIILLWAGSIKTIQNVLVGLVTLLSIAFVAVAILSQPKIGDIFSGLLPAVNNENILSVASLIGTTVVPYNLFLYASLARNKWSKPEEVQEMRLDIWVAVILGGIVSMAIIAVGASSPSEEIRSAVDLSEGLETYLGSSAKFLMALGLLGAGITSSITAPLATGLVICGLFGWDQNISSRPMRRIMIGVVLLGIVFSSLGLRPVQLIMLAQIANGILLPLISGWIIWIASKRNLLGINASKPIGKLIGAIVWLISLGLGIKSIVQVLS